MPPVLTVTASFPSVFFHLQQYSKQHPSFPAHKAALMTRTDWFFSAFSLTLVDFAVQFCFRCRFSFHEKPFESSLTVAWFWNNHNFLLRITTNEIASFCVDNTFFRVSKVGKGRLSSNWERFWNNIFEKELIEGPFCEKQGRFSKIFICRKCNDCGLTGLCVLCFKNNVKHYLAEDVISDSQFNLTGRQLESVPY